MWHIARRGDAKIRGLIDGRRGRKNVHWRYGIRGGVKIGIVLTMRLEVPLREMGGVRRRGVGRVVHIESSSDPKLVYGVWGTGGVQRVGWSGWK